MPAWRGSASTAGLALANIVAEQHIYRICQLGNLPANRIKKR
jgi:hypothetical protein